MMLWDLNSNREALLLVEITIKDDELQGNKELTERLRGLVLELRSNITNTVTSEFMTAQGTHVPD